VSQSVSQVSGWVRQLLGWLINEVVVYFLGQSVSQSVSQ
jgi:hypothetical protein